MKSKPIPNRYNEKLPEEPRPKKNLSNVKVLLTVFFDFSFFELPRSYMPFA